MYAMKTRLARRRQQGGNIYDYIYVDQPVEEREREKIAGFEILANLVYMHACTCIVKAVGNLNGIKEELGVR